MTTTTLSYRQAHHGSFSISGIQVPWKAVYVLALLASVVLLILYVFMVDQLTKGAYTIRNYNKEIASLTNENGVLQANFAESGFLGQVQQRALALNFQKTTNVAYVHILQSSLAEVPKNYQK